MNMSPPPVLYSDSTMMYANPENFAFVWVGVQEPLPNRLIKQQQEVDSYVYNRK